MTPGLELSDVATLKCVLLRRPVQSAEFCGFAMDSEFFPGVIPLNWFCSRSFEIITSWF